VHVGKKSCTCAQFILHGPADVLRFLTRLERELA
jgi:hypothetical protein